MGGLRPSVTAAEAAFVVRLARAISSDGRAPVLVGAGSNNWVWRQGEGADAVAIKVGKPHRADVTAQEHAKELWCAAAARAVGVPTPAIAHVGAFEDRPYQLQAFAPGRPPMPREHPRIWEAMGGWARAIHDIPVSGWGLRLAADGVFAEDWERHVAYNIAALCPGDPLLALGVLDAASAADLKRRFERLASTPLPFGLAHADLGPHNVLVDDKDGALTLIDWGCAGAFPAPYYEINEIIRADRATPADLDAFRRGYGLSDTAFAAMTGDLRDLGLLRDIDTLRWAIDQRPDEIDALAGRARRALDRLSKDGLIRR